eukprot:s727_g8.t2
MKMGPGTACPVELMGKKAKLKCTEGDVFELPADAVALAYRARTDLLDKGCDAELQYPIKKAVMLKLVEYLKHHREHACSEIRTPLISDNLAECGATRWDASFVNMDKEMLFDLTVAASYLDIPGLWFLLSAKAAIITNKKSADKLRKEFSMANDLPAAEEAELKRDIAASLRLEGEVDLSQLAASSVIRSGVKAAEYKAGIKQLEDGLEPPSSAISNLSSWRHALWRAAVLDDWKLLQNAPEQVKNDRDLVKSAILTSQGAALKLASPEMRADEALDFAVAVAKRNGKALKFMIPAFRADPDVVRAAITRDPQAAQYAHASRRAELGMIQDSMHGEVQLQAELESQKKAAQEEAASTLALATTAGPRQVPMQALPSRPTYTCMKLQKTVQFTAMSTMTANMGQSNYIAANSYLDKIPGMQRPEIDAVGLMWGAVGGIGMRFKAFASEDILNATPELLLTIPDSCKVLCAACCTINPPEWFSASHFDKFSREMYLSPSAGQIKLEEQTTEVAAQAHWEKHLEDDRKALQDMASVDRRPVPDNFALIKAPAQPALANAPLGGWPSLVSSPGRSPRNRGSELRRVEQETGTFMFMALDSRGEERLLIFGANAGSKVENGGRMHAERLVNDLVQEKLRNDERRGGRDSRSRSRRSSRRRLATRFCGHRKLQQRKDGHFEHVRRASPGFNFREVGIYGTPLMALMAVDIWIPDELNEVNFQQRVAAARFCMSKGADPLQHVPSNCSHQLTSMVPQILMGAETEEDAQVLLQEMTTTGDRLRTFDQLFRVPSPRGNPQLPVASDQRGFFSRRWSEILKDYSTTDVEILAVTDDGLSLRPDFKSHCHSFVLCKASPVFARLLQEDPSSPKRLELAATGVAIKAFLHLIYTGSFEGSTWPDVPLVVSVARLAAESQTWFVLPALVQHMRCNLSEFTFCPICKFALDFRQDSLLSACQHFVRTYESRVPQSEWVSWSSYLSDHATQDVQQLVYQALHSGHRDCRVALAATGQPQQESSSMKPAPWTRTDETGCRLLRMSVRTAQSGFDYAKWDRLEISDDETTFHPNLDKGLNIRVNRITRERKEDEIDEDARKAAKLEGRRPLHVDNVCRVAEEPVDRLLITRPERTIIQSGDGSKKDRLKKGEEFSVDEYTMFKQDNQRLLDKFAEADWETSEGLLKEYGHILMESYANSYFMLEALDAEMRGERRKRGSWGCVFSARIACNRDEDETSRAAFEEGVSHFTANIIQRAVVKKEEGNSHMRAEEEAAKKQAEAETEGLEAKPLVEAMHDMPKAAGIQDNVFCGGLIRQVMTD